MTIQHRPGRKIYKADIGTWAPVVSEDSSDTAPKVKPVRSTKPKKKKK